MTIEEREDFSQEKREKIEEATELIIEKVKANDIDGVKGIIEKMYDDGYKRGMEAVWPWLWTNDRVEFPFGIDYDNPDFLNEEKALRLFKVACDKEAEHLIEVFGDTEDTDTIIRGFLASTHLINRYTGLGFGLFRNDELETASN